MANRELAVYPNTVRWLKLTVYNAYILMHAAASFFHRWAMFTFLLMYYYRLLSGYATHTPINDAITI